MRKMMFLEGALEKYTLFGLQLKKSIATMQLRHRVILITSDQNSELRGPARWVFLLNDMNAD